MGASGAGKSGFIRVLSIVLMLICSATFVNVLMGKQAHTGGKTRVNGVPGKMSKYDSWIILSLIDRLT
jgi:hypothetical protein